MIRHLGAHLDQGLAAWRSPLLGQGFYAAWRHSAGSDLAWELDEFVGVRNEIEQLPDDVLQAIDGELLRLGVEDAKRDAYLQRLVLELPGWAGMCCWREAHPRTGEAPVSLADFVAVRLVLERLHAEQLLWRIWGLPPRLTELGDYFAANVAELLVRHAFGCQQLSEDQLDAVTPYLASAAADAGASWQRAAASMAGGFATPPGSDPGDGERAAWPLFVLAQALGLSAGDLRTIGASGTQALLDCAASLSRDQRGQIWLLAYEHHYRQQILAALAANHGRAAPLSGRAACLLYTSPSPRD